MYTRSFPRQPSQRPSVPDTASISFSPEQKSLSEKDIPEGYSGTAILREREKDVSSDRVNGDLSSVIPSPPAQRVIHARRLKVSTKITPSLWQEDAEECESKDGSSVTDSCERNNIPSVSHENIPFGDHCQKENSRVEHNAKAQNLEGTENAHTKHNAKSQNFEGTENEPCGTDARERRCRKTVGKRYVKRRFSVPCDRKRDTCPPHVPKLSQRTFTLEDLLLGGLILLLINEGADDDVILIFGFLLFSSL